MKLPFFHGILFSFITVSLYAQLPVSPPVPGAEPSGEDSLRRTTPQSSVLAFVSAVRRQDYADASQYLDLDKIPGPERQTRTSEIANQLANFLDAAPDFNIAAVSNDPEGDRNDGLPAGLERIYQSSTGKFVAEMERKRLAPDGPQVWIYRRYSESNWVGLA